MTPLSLLKAAIHRLGSAYTKELCRREYLSQTFEGINERPVEYRFAFQHLTRVWPKTVLDVGTGRCALPSLMRTCGFVVSAIDNVGDYWPKGMFNRHYHIIDEDILAPKIRDRYDFVTCISTLEHIRDHNRAVSMMFSLLRPGGTLLLSFPYNESTYVENVYAMPGSIGADRYSFTTQVFSRREIDTWLEQNRAELCDQEFWQFFTGEFWTIGDRIVPPVPASRNAPHQISCIVLRKTDSASDSDKV
jgi:SAM-dependent methyltransferase